MFPSDNFNPIIKELMNRLGGIPNSNEASNNKEQRGKNGKNHCSGNGGKNNNTGGNGSKNSKVNITPSQALIIAGMLGGVLEVDSVLVDRDQTVQIVLAGSLKEKTQLEKVMDQIGSMSFDDVMKAVIERLT